MSLQNYNDYYTPLFLNCRFRVRNIPSDSKFSVDADIRVCFDATNNTCQTDVSVLKASDLLYTECSSDDKSVPFKGKHVF